MTKRSALEVNVEAEETSSVSNKDPILVFVYMLMEQNKNKYRGNYETVITNKNLLECFVQNNYITKSSIIWKNGKISKIYGIKMNDDGIICYNRTPKRSPEKNTSKYVTNNTKIDLSAIRNAVETVRETSNVP